MTERVLVVDDHPVFRRGLCTLLSTAGMDVVGEAGGEEEAVQLAGRLAPQIVVMDLGLPDGSGITATARITAARPDVRVIVLTLFDDDGSVRAALAAGATGYVVKDAMPAEIISAVRATGLGARVLGSGVAGAPLLPEAQTGVPGLTPREQDVARLLAKGLPNRIIAARLGLAGKTVANNVSAILAKLGVPDRVAAAELLRREGP